jgi:hypothetical protein
MALIFRETIQPYLQLWREYATGVRHGERFIKMQRMQRDFSVGERGLVDLKRVNHGEHYLDIPMIRVTQKHC